MSPHVRSHIAGAARDTYRNANGNYCECNSTLCVSHAVQRVTRRIDSRSPTPTCAKSHRGIHTDEVRCTRRRRQRRRWCYARSIAGHDGGENAQWKFESDMRLGNNRLSNVHADAIFALQLLQIILCFILNVKN